MFCMGLPGNECQHLQHCTATTDCMMSWRLRINTRIILLQWSLPYEGTAISGHTASCGHNFHALTCLSVTSLAPPYEAAPPYVAKLALQIEWPHEAGTTVLSFIIVQVAALLSSIISFITSICVVIAKYYNV